MQDINLWLCRIKDRNQEKIVLENENEIIFIQKNNLYSIGNNSNFTTSTYDSNI